MNKFIYFENNKMVINYDNIKKYSNMIRIIINDLVFFEGDINDKLYFDMGNRENGTYIKLYINKFNDWYYIDSTFLSNSKSIKPDKSKILKYFDIFETEIRCIINENKQ